VGHDGDEPVDNTETEAEDLVAIPQI